MKRTFFILILLFIAFLAQSRTEEPTKSSNPLIGTWRSDSLIIDGENRWSDDRKGILTFSETHMIYVHFDAKGLVRSCGGGIYTYKNGKLTRLMEFGTADRTRAIGTKVEFEIKFQEDSFTQIGTLASGQKIEQTWKRIERETE